MKIVVVYESIYGNTAAVARAVAEGLGASGDVVCERSATSRSRPTCSWWALRRTSTGCRRR